MSTRASTHNVGFIKEEGRIVGINFGYADHPDHENIRLLASAFDFIPHPELRADPVCAATITDSREIPESLRFGDNWYFARTNELWSQRMRGKPIRQSQLDIEVDRPAGIRRFTCDAHFYAAWGGTEFIIRGSVEAGEVFDAMRTAFLRREVAIALIPKACTVYARAGLVMLSRELASNTFIEHFILGYEGT